MKKRISLFLSICVAASFFQTSAHSQGKIVETAHFKSNPDLGGDVVINRSTKEATGDRSLTTFEIEAEAGGSYALSLWASPVLYPGGNYSAFDVYVNGKKITGQVKFSRGNWQAVTFPEKINITKGINTVAFSAGKEEIPAVEFIRLSTDAQRAKISSAAYDDYLANAKAGSSNYGAGKRYTGVNDSSVNYLYFDSVPFSYTYYSTRYFSSGQSVSVSATTPNDSIFLIIDVFSSSQPENYAWSTGIQPYTVPTLNIPFIPFSDSYYVRVRPYWNGVSTTATVNINGTVEKDVPIFGTGLRAIQDTLRVYNTFTVRSKGDPWIWITEYDSVEKITHYNNNYDSLGGDFDWGLDARIKKQFPRPVDAILLSSYGSYNPQGVADVYARCRNSDTTGFPNLKADDAIESDTASVIYNSISWSGGITDYWEWPPFPSSRYYVPNDPLASFDLFYSSWRYPGSAVFTREGATFDNSVVDLWATEGVGGYVYTHASIKKGADGNPHGYDWESKLDGFQRVFHPRTALRGSRFGNIVQYYKKAWSWQPRTLAEAIAEGKAVLETAIFNDAETALIKNNIANLSPDDVKTFRSLFAAWQSTLKSAPFNNPYLFKNSRYDALLAFCRSKQDLISLVYDKLSEEQFAILLVEDLTLAGNRRNQSLLESVKNSDNRMKTTGSGTVVVSSPYSNMIKYVKALLAERR